MKQKFLIIAAGLALLLGGGLFLVTASNADSAATVETVDTENALKTVSFDVPGMTCPTCPYTVKKTLQKIDGVTEAESSFETMSATATFDPAKTNIDEMLEALKNQGYPSSVAEGQCDADETAMKC